MTQELKGLLHRHQDLSVTLAHPHKWVSWYVPITAALGRWGQEGLGLAGHLTVAETVSSGLRKRLVLKNRRQRVSCLKDLCSKGTIVKSVTENDPKGYALRVTL